LLVSLATTSAGAGLAAITAEDVILAPTSTSEGGGEEEEGWVLRSGRCFATSSEEDSMPGMSGTGNSFGGGEGEEQSSKLSRTEGCCTSISRSAARSIPFLLGGNVLSSFPYLQLSQCLHDSTFTALPIGV